ncbi:MAG: hypothetical protein R3E87_04815 [Burkholderiaceae bacterium]
MSTQRTTAGFMAMKGAGYYSKATAGAKIVMDNAADMVLDSVRDLPIPGGGASLRVADMGAADGGTSVDLWRHALKALRERAPGVPIEMVYTDLPRNDFSQVFQLVHGLTDTPSYLPEIDGVYVFTSGTSFHQPIFPPQSLHLGFSATASHYISEIPCDISDHVHMVGASGLEREAFTVQGARDWANMLALRARELVPGGRLCLFNFGIDEQGRYLGHTGGVSMFDTFNELWTQLRDEGRISADEYRKTNFPQHYRTVAEFTAPLKDETSPVFQAGLRLVHAETRVVRCPFEQDFTENHRDAERFAREYLPTLRSWSEATFVNGLDPARAPEDKAAIVDEFYGRYQNRVARSPQGHAMDYVHCYLVCEKLG